MSSTKEIVVSGIRPTGFLHLGNYFGAVRNFVQMQEEYTCFFFIADWHSLTTHPDTRILNAQIKQVVAEYIAAGLNPKKCAIYLQSQVPEIAELYLYLNMSAYVGELEKTTTFKEKIRKQPENINAGLLTYPVLMAADILIHNAAYVPVGKDQEQHLEMARNFAARFNHRYEDFFTLPKAFNFDKQLVKIGSLDGMGKMSKSDNALTTIYLSDTDEQIHKKIMKAKTDLGPEQPNSPMPDYIENLFTLLRLTASADTYQKFLYDYNHCSIRYGDFKKELVQNMLTFLQPIRVRAKEILADTPFIHNILEEGGNKARLSARKNLQMIREKMHLL